MTDERVSISDGDGVDNSTATTAPARSRNILPLLILPILAFALGVALTVWAWPQIQRRWSEPQSRSTTALPAPATRAGLPAAAPPRPLAADSAQMLDGRVVQLEERLTRITVEAQAASANAARAEGLLVAFAARRALDNGGPLGYVEGQLRLRFGQAQPRAVATIINAAREPVTLADLRAGLADISDAITTPPSNASWWEAMRHEARELITIRNAATPSPRPEAAYDRAMRYLDGGRVSAALAEVEHMPGRSVAERWVQMARRYMEARRALDLIETAAILEPRTLRNTNGAAIEQTSPFAP